MVGSVIDCEIEVGARYGPGDELLSKPRRCSQPARSISDLSWSYGRRGQRRRAGRIWKTPCRSLPNSTKLNQIHELCVKPERERTCRRRRDDGAAVNGDWASVVAFGARGNELAVRTEVRLPDGGLYGLSSGMGDER